MELELISAQIATLSLKPDDTIVVRCKCRITVEVADRLKKMFQEASKHNKVIVIEDSIELTVLEAA